MRCDFCSEPDVRWELPCRDFIHVAQPSPEARLIGGMRGSWAACQECYTLAVNGDREGLARRSAQTMIDKHGARIPLPILTTVCRDLHDAFWSNREGAPIPARPEDST